jgi:hypothetical protein
MPKIIWSCSNCGTVLPLWRIKCSNCQGRELSWFHLLFVAVTAVPLILFLFLKLI